MRPVFSELQPPDELISLSDRLVVMAAGKIVYSAPIKEIDRQLMEEKMASH